MHLIRSLKRVGCAVVGLVGLLLGSNLLTCGEVAAQVADMDFLQDTQREQAWWAQYNHGGTLPPPYFSLEDIAYLRSNGAVRIFDPRSSSMSSQTGTLRAGPCGSSGPTCDPAKEQVCVLHPKDNTDGRTQCVDLPFGNNPKFRWVLQQEQALPDGYDGINGPLSMADIDWVGPFGSGRLCWWKKDASGKPIVRRCARPPKAECRSGSRGSIRGACDPQKGGICAAPGDLSTTKVASCQSLPPPTASVARASRLADNDIVTSVAFDLAIPKGEVVDPKTGCLQLITCIKLKAPVGTSDDIPILWVPYVPPAEGWQVLPGEARGLGVGGDGQLWVIGTNLTVGTAGFSLYRWNGSDGFNAVFGGALRLDVDAQGNAWIVTAEGFIRKWNGNAFQNVPGGARDIGVGQGGAAWVIGMDEGVYRWNGSTWDKIDNGPAKRIDVEPTGQAWMVTKDGDIRRFQSSSLVDVPGQKNGTWFKVPGKARDIGIGGDGSVFVVAPDGGVYKWSGGDWIRRPGWLAAISVDGRGVPYGITPVGEILRGTP